MHLPNFGIITQERRINQCKGGVLIYIQISLTCNLRNDLCASDKDKEILTIEISRENDKSIPLCCCYRLPNGDSEKLSAFLQDKIIEKSVAEMKISCIKGDFNMNYINITKILKQNSFTITF